jgi:FKBP-type peptidyl-prolyl cis-trans isomerase
MSRRCYRQRIHRCYRPSTDWPLALCLLAALVTTAGCEEKADRDQAAQPAQDDQAGKANIRVSNAREKKPPMTPPMDVSAPPADAQKTPSGLAYVILAEGAQDQQPGVNDTVRIHYTVWSTRGDTRFSTRHRDRPQGRYLPQQPPGWVEALTTMKLGEKRLVWMPPELAHTGRGPKPTETLVYELELVEIEAAPPPPPNLSAPPANAKKTASGIPYEEIAPGTGLERPRRWDQVAVHYTAWDAKGKMLQSTHTRQRPQSVNLLRANPGWVDVLENMVVGQKVRAWIPASELPILANVPKDATVVYEFELTEIKKQKDPPPVPNDVAAPPKGAKKTAKGVFYKVLKPGTGKARPKVEQIVRVHYTGWTTDGKMFDSSVVRDSPARFPLGNVIAGWTDGLQTMVVGETTRFWIPEELAYKGREGSPKGMLVFDVELLEIIDPPKPPPMPDNHPSVDGPHGAPQGAPHGTPQRAPQGAQRAPQGAQGAPQPQPPPQRPTPPGQK